MSAWGDSELLVELLDRHFGFFERLEGTDKIIRLRRVVGFINEEPALSALLHDAHLEAENEQRELQALEATVRTKLVELWSKYGAEIRPKIESETDPSKAEALRAYAVVKTYEAQLAKPRTFDLSAPESDDGRPGNLIAALRQWWGRAHSEEETFPEGDERASVRAQLEVLWRVWENLERRLFAARRSLAWSAYERLASKVDLLNPALPPIDREWTMLEWARLAHEERRAETIEKAEVVAVGASNEPQVSRLYAELEQDAKLLHEELRLRLGVTRTRLNLIKRYAARCAGLDAKRLRSTCEADTRNAERQLTIDLARYVFDAGIPPLIDATATGLRPDILSIGARELFYVEAKQYAGPHPAAQIRKAFAQAWSTWGRLRQSYTSSEAFLVIFRRSGPWLDLPPVVRHDTLKLYPVLADISKDAGSRETQHPICFTEAEIRPAALADLANEAKSEKRRRRGARAKRS